MIGQTIANYRIISELARGGMGVVYRAEHVTMGQHAVIKQVLPEYTRNAEIVTRFLQEARAAAAIDDLGVVKIFDQGLLPDGSAYLTMEFLAGESLAARLRAGPLPVELALPLLRQVLRVLGAAHRIGIVHRDLKPDNLFLVPDPDIACGLRAKVLDFGIAKLSSAGVMKTSTGMPMGTPAYMSPEQWRSAGRVDGRTDIYAVGCILVEMLTGRPAFRGPGFPEFLDQHRFEPPPMPSASDARLSSFDGVVARALAKDPEERFRTPEEMSQTLDVIAAARPSGATPVAVAPVTAATPPQATAVPADSVPPIVRTAKPTLPAARRRRTLILAGAGVLGVVVTAVVARLGSGSTSTSATTSTTSTPSAAPASSPAWEPSGPSGPPTPAPTSTAAPPLTAASQATSSGALMSRTERLGDLTNARQAQADKKWKQAIAQADDVLARFPDSDEAKQIKQKATTELAQAPIFERFQRERLAGKVADAVVDFRKLSATSVYKSEAQPLFDKMRDSWLKDRLSEAKRLADQRNCDQVRTLMSEARDLFPDDIGTFSQVNRACLADTVQRLKQYNADADLRSATLKLKLGRWAEARSEADKALEYRPDEPDALAVAATAACQLHDKEAAIQYIARLKADPRVSELKEICAHEGIILE